MPTRSSVPALGPRPRGDRLIHRNHPVADLHPLRRAQAGAGRRQYEGGVGGEDIEVAGERVVFVVRPAAEPDFKDVAALLVAFAVDVAPAVDILGLAARLVLPEPRRHLAAIPIGKRSSQDRGPRAVDLQGDGLLAVRLNGPGTLTHANHLVLNKGGVDRGSFNYD